MTHQPLPRAAEAHTVFFRGKRFVCLLSSGSRGSLAMSQHHGTESGGKPLLRLAMFRLLSLRDTHYKWPVSLNMGFRWCWLTHLPRRSRCPDLERLRAGAAERRRRRCLERGLRAPVADAPGLPVCLGTERQAVAAGAAEEAAAASSPPLSAARSWPAGTSGFLGRRL